MSSTTRVVNMTVASGATVSSIFQGSGFVEFGITVPAEFDGTSVTFETATSIATAGTFQALYSAANTAVSMTVAASRNYPAPSELKSWPYWRIITAVAQTGATVFVATGKST